MHFENIIFSFQSIDDISLLLIRSLFNTYADLVMGMFIFSENKFRRFPVIDIKHVYSPIFDQIKTILRNQLESMYQILLSLSQDSNCSQQIKRTGIFFHLQICRWNRL